MAATMPAQQEIPPRPPGGLQMKETKRGKVYVGELSPEFLRIQSQAFSQRNQYRNDSAMAQQLALQQQQQMMGMATTERLVVTIVEAKLNKNYGITKMDPYCRVRIGHAIYETATAQNGAKLPYWGKTVYAQMAEGVNHIDIDIFDERAFSTDNRIAWAKVVLPESIKRGNSEDDWWPLSGKLGDEKEGMIHLQLSVSKQQRPVYYAPPMGVPMVAPPMMIPSQGYVIPPRMPMPGQQPQVQAPVVTEEDLKQVKEMFPDMDDDVIKTVLEASRGNKDAAINSLLSMQS